MTDPTYAREKFGAAVHELACHPGRIRERLLVAVVAGSPGFGYVPPLDHVELSRKLKWIKAQLTSRQAVGGECQYAASIDAMTEDEAVLIASRIVDVECELGIIAEGGAVVRG